MCVLSWLGCSKTFSHFTHLVSPFVIFLLTVLELRNLRSSWPPVSVLLIFSLFCFRVFLVSDSSFGAGFPLLFVWPCSFISSPSELCLFCWALSFLAICCSVAEDESWCSLWMCSWTFLLMWWTKEHRGQMKERDREPGENTEEHSGLMWSQQLFSERFFSSYLTSFLVTTRLRWAQSSDLNLLLLNSLNPGRFLRCRNLHPECTPRWTSPLQCGTAGSVQSAALHLHCLLELKHVTQIVN